MASVLVVMPTRGRPSAFARAVRSIVESSTIARVKAYVDDDEPFMERYAIDHGPRVEVVVGPRIGVSLAADTLMEDEDYDAVGLVTDDSIVHDRGWDEWIVRVMDDWPGRVGAVSPHHNFGRHVDMPFVSRCWVEALGWFAEPNTHHFGWPTIIGMLAESIGCIRHAGRNEFFIEHRQEAAYTTGDMKNDALATYLYFLNRFYSDRDRLLAKIDGRTTDPAPVVTVWRSA